MDTESTGKGFGLDKKKLFFSFGSAAVGIAAAALFESERERRSLVVRRYELRSPKIERPRRIVYLSDFHERRLGDIAARLLKETARLRPDYIFLGGDMVTAKHGASIQATLALTERLAEIAPVYYGEGNHEARLDRDRGRYLQLFDDLQAGLGRQGVHYLSDETVLLGDDLALSGLHITENFYRRAPHDEMREDYVQSHLGAANATRFQLLFAHSPAFFDAYARWGADLTFAGHWHGGTVRLPGNIGLMTPQFEFFRGPASGLFYRGEHAMLLSPGIGTHSINLRFMNLPELMVLELRKGRGHGR